VDAEVSWSSQVVPLGVGRAQHLGAGDSVLEAMREFPADSYRSMVTYLTRSPNSNPCVPCSCRYVVQLVPIKWGPAALRVNFRVSADRPKKTVPRTWRAHKALGNPNPKS
jgi:hypothetical protein